MNKQSFSEFIRVVGVVVVIGVLVFLIYYFVVKDAPINPGGDIDASVLERLTPKTSVSIVLVLIGLLAWMFWLTISFGRRLSERSYLGPLTKDALMRAEINRQEDDLKEDLKAGVFAAEIAINKDFRLKWRIPEDSSVPLLTPGVSLDDILKKTTQVAWDEGGWGSTEEEPIVRLSAEQLVAEQNKIREGKTSKYTLYEINTEIDNRYKDGYQREQMDLFYKERAKIRVSARDYAQKLLPGIDVSAFGGGWIFVLEFTTIIFIIFAALALGFVGVLGSEQIGTILAAIAGYVLGKSTSMKSPEGAEIVRGAEQPTAVMDLLAKQSENRAKTDDEKKALAEKITQLEKELSNAKIIVPDLRKKTFADAEKELKEKGLLASRKDVITDSDEPGLVFEQVPAGKEELAKGSMVVLLVASKKDAQENLQSSPPTPPVPLSPPPEEQQENEPQKDKDKIEIDDKPDEFDDDQDSEVEGPVNPV